MFGYVIFMFSFLFIRKVSQEKQSFNASRLDAWINVIQRKDFVNEETENAVVYSDHFIIGMFVYLLCMQKIQLWRNYCKTFLEALKVIVNGLNQL